jgi:hypothetical protein
MAKYNPGRSASFKKGEMVLTFLTFQSLLGGFTDDRPHFICLHSRTFRLQS